MRSLTAAGFRGVALCAIAAGYVMQRGSALIVAAVDRMLPTRGWSEREMGNARLKVPPSWGEVELEPSGPVVYNRPRRFRVDGDAVWYSTAVEIRVRHREAPGLSHESPMTEITRVLPFDRDHVVAAAMANGLSAKARRTVEHVLRSARPASGPNHNKE